jgi:hypothetical protein
MSELKELQERINLIDNLSSWYKKDRESIKSLMKIDPDISKSFSLLAKSEEDFAKNYDIYKSNYEIFCDRIRYLLIRKNIIDSLVHNDRFKIKEDLTFDPSIKYAAEISLINRFEDFDLYDMSTQYRIYFTQYISSINNEDYYDISIDIFSGIEFSKTGRKNIWNRIYVECFNPRKNIVHVKSNILESNKFNMKIYNSVCHLLDNLMTNYKCTSFSIIHNDDLVIY